MSLNIVEIVLGLDDGQAVRCEPLPDTVNILSAEQFSADAAEVARTLRDTLALTRRTAGKTALPFVRIRAHRGLLDIAIADDASADVRVLEESLDERIPLFVEASTVDPADDARLELISAKIADAFGIGRPEAIGAALLRTDPAADEAEHSSQPGDQSDAQRALEKDYRRAVERASGLASQVRAIDDQMTESVVPGWLFAASGVGGLGVTMTAVTFFNPQLMRYVVPAMVLLLIAGLSAYAYKSWRELQVRGRLQDNRAQLREERQNARAEVARLAEAIRAAGADPDETLARLGGAEGSFGVPLITARPTAIPAELDALEALGRQVLVVIDSGDVSQDKLRSFEDVRG